MKKMFIAGLMLVAISGSTVACAQSMPVFKGMKSFTSSFPGAETISCGSLSNCTEVDFTWKSHQMKAYYDTEGNCSGILRRVPTESLPLFLLMKINESFPGGVTTQVWEFYNDDKGLSYYVFLAAEKKDYILQATSAGFVNVIRKIRK